MNEPTHPGLSVVVVECADQQLIDAVERALVTCYAGTTRGLAIAAIAAIHEYEESCRWRIPGAD